MWPDQLRVSCPRGDWTGAKPGIPGGESDFRNPRATDPPAHSQVAIIAGNFELAEVIKTHKDSDVGESCPGPGVG